MSAITSVDDPRLWGPKDSVPYQDVFDVYLSAIRELFDDAYLQRKGELRRNRSERRVKWSQRDQLWGRVRACEELVPELRELGASMDAILQEAEEEAWRWFQKAALLGEQLEAA